MTNHCYETGQPLPEGMKDTAKFSSDAARSAWNNRRKNRGAELYDLVMAWRFDRRMAGGLKVLSRICAMAARWHAEDKAAGRQSFTPTEEAVARQTGR